MLFRSRHALELDPAFAAAHALLAHVNLARWWAVEKNTDFLAAARAQIDQARQIDPELPEVDIEEGYYHYWGFLDYESALAALEPLLPQYPNNIDLLQVIAFVNRRYGRFDTTLEFLLRVEPRAPRDRTILYSIGETYAALRRWPEAQEYIDKLIEIDPNFAQGHQLRGWVLAGRDGDFAGAQRYLGLAARELPYESLPYWFYQLRAGDFEGAMNTAETVAETDLYRESSPLSLLQGLTLHLSGDSEAAVPLLSEAKNLLAARLGEKPGNFELMSALCLVHGALGETTQTITACEAAVAAMPDDSFIAQELRVTLASGLAMGGATDRAFELLSSLTDSAVGPGSGELQADPRLANLKPLEDWQKLIAELDARP